MLTWSSEGTSLSILQNNETPLHFACKLGYEEIVSFLMTFPGINTTVRNKYGKTPDEIVCQSASNTSTAVRERIAKLVRGK